MQHTNDEERYYSRPWKEIALELTTERNSDRIQELTTELLRALSLPPFAGRSLAGPKLVLPRSNL